MPEYPTGSTNPMPESMMRKGNEMGVEVIDRLYTADALAWGLRQNPPIVDAQKARARYALTEEGSPRFRAFEEAHEDESSAAAKFKAQHGEVCSTCNGTGLVRS